MRPATVIFRLQTGTRDRGREQLMKYMHIAVTPGMCTPGFLEQFRCFLAALPQYHYHQDAEWYLCNAGSGYELLVTYQGDEIVASSVLRKVRYRFMRRGKCLITNGPLYRDVAALVAHIGGLQEMMVRNTIDIRVSPPVSDDNLSLADRSLTEAGFRRYRTDSGNYTSTVTLDLEQGIEGLAAGFSPSLRRQLRKARNSEVHVSTVSEPGELRELLELSRRFYLDRGLGFPEPAVLDCYVVRKLLEKKEGIALSLQYEGQPVAGIVVIGCGSRAIFSFGFRKAGGQLSKLPLSHLLHYRAIKWATEHDYCMYDFGGYSSSGADDGVNRFKLGFSGRIETVSENYICTFHPLITMMLNAMGRLKSVLSSH